MVNKIILNGRGGSGKDVFADYLVEHHGYTKLAFADGIYKIAYDLFDMKAKNRDLLQKIGQKMREIDPVIWVSDTYKRADRIDRVVISDCRQHNEFATGLQLGYLPIRINCDRDIRIKRLEARDGFYPDLSLLENDSETGADNCEFIEVSNNNGYEDLYAQIEGILSNKGYYKSVVDKIRMEYEMSQRY